MKDTYYFVLFAFALFSCSDKTDNRKISTQLIENALEIDLNNETSNISRGLQGYSNNETNYLFNINWHANSLQVYDIETANLIKEIFFEVDGENGVGQIFGFHVHKLDSIFLFTQLSPEIILIDTSGYVHNRIKYIQPTPYTNAFVHNAYFLSPPILVDNDLIVKAHVEGNYRQMTNNELQQRSLFYSINLKSRETRLSATKYPDGYLANGLKFFEYSMASDGEKLAFSFFGDHRIFYLDAAGSDVLKQKAAKSKYLKEELPKFPLNAERAETYAYLFAKDRYESLLYDPFREVYYRFAYPEVDFQDVEELTKFREAPKKFSVIVLDTEFEVLDEILFDGSRHIPNNVFVGKKGLYLSTSHPDNPANLEDKMVFDLLEISL